MYNTKILSGFMMALGLSFHFFGYEAARAASISLLAAKETGLGSEALSYVQMVGSPASGLILYLYAKSIKTRGPKFTMRVSEVFCLLLLGLILGISGHVKGLPFQISVVVFYAFREIYVSLISTQQWAFIASILDSSTSSYMVSFSGIVGISSAVGGCMVEFLVTKWGVKGLLATAFISSVLCFICAELAYFISHGAENDEQVVSHDKSKNDSTSKLKLSVWRESLELFKKHRTLQILFIEAIFHQLVGNMLNLMFHDALRLNILDDDHRALMVGRFFATVNIASCLLQFFVLPSVLSQSTLPQVLANIPMLVFVTTMTTYLFPSLVGVMIAFGTLKVIEYSVITVATEMIYMPMDKDVRYLGKELVKFFGHKLGKSGSSIFLSIVSAQYNPTMTFQAGLTFFTSGFWAISMYMLAIHLKTKGNLNPQKDLQDEKVDKLNEKPINKDSSGYFDNMYFSDTTNESGSDIASLDSTSSASLCDIYGSEVITPPSTTYYPAKSSTWSAESDTIGLSLEDDPFHNSSMGNTNSNNTFSGFNGVVEVIQPGGNIVEGIVTVNKDFVERESNFEGLRRRKENQNNKPSKLHENKDHSNKINDSTQQIDSNSKNYSISTLLSYFSPLKKKRNTMLRVGSEAVMFKTLLEKAARRKKSDEK